MISVPMFAFSVAPETILPINDMTDDMRTHHMLSEEGVKACHRVLYVISETHPHIQQVSCLEIPKMLVANCCL